LIADRQSLVELLEPQRVLGERRISKIVGLRARGQDEVVVRDRSVVRKQAPGCEVDPRDRRLEEVRVAQRADQLAHGTRDLTGVEQRRSHLVEQRREHVVVVAVDQQDVDWGSLQCPRAREAAEARARDHDSRAVHCGG